MARTDLDTMDQFERELAEASHQRSEEWRDVRCGKFTASQLYRLMTEPRSKADKEAGAWSQGALTYIHEKVAEELTGVMIDKFGAKATEWGEVQEEFAAVEFNSKTGLPIKKAGFVPFTDHAGGSPDGFVSDDAILEIKCPFNSGNQIDYLLISGPEEIKESWPEYWYQMQANMLFTKLHKCYFVTYDPRMPENLKLNYTIIHADPEEQQRILEKLDKAILTKQAILKMLRPDLSPVAI